MGKTADLLPGTLDMLILKAVSLEAAARLRRAAAHPPDLRARRSTSRRARSIRRSTGWSTRGSSPPSGGRATTTAAPSSTP